MKTYGAITYRRDEGTWEITAEPDVSVRLKRIFPRLQASRLGTMTLTHTDEVARDLEWVLLRWPMDVDAVSLQAMEAASRQHRDLGERVNNILAGRAVHAGLRMAPVEAMTPRDYQMQAYDLAMATRSLLLADDLGLGKTLSATLSLADPDLRPALVVTLTGLPRQWVKELGKTFPDLRGHEVTKGTPYDLTDEDGRTPDLIAMNYAKLAGWADHLAGRVRTVIFDEVQELRRDSSQKHQAACRVAHDADVVWGLSATPVYNYGGEMYSILSVLAPGLLGDKKEFAREWCKTNNGVDVKTRIADPGAFRTWLTEQGVLLRRTRDAVGISVPEATLAEQYVDADEKALQAASGNAAEMARLILAQDTSHRDRWRLSGDFDWRMRQATGIAKASFVADFTRLVLETQERVILLGWHRSVWDIWLERLRDFNPVMYTGSESATQKARSFDQFIAGESRVLMMSLRSGAGLDGLQDVASALVFGELDWSPGVHTQAIGRLHRPGQKSGVLAYFCVSEHGSDPFMADVLNLKQMQTDLLFSPEKRAGAVVDDNTDHIRRMAEAVLRKTARTGHP